MSNKSKVKGLTYDSTLPPFLQKLHDQNSGRRESGRHERPIARPKKAKDADEDDGPTVVDESGNLVSTDDLRALNTPSDGPVGDNTDAGIDGNAASTTTDAKGEPATNKTVEKITDGVAQKKRKAVKVIGADDQPAEKESVPVPRAKKPKKAATKPKLAFADED